MNIIEAIQQAEQGALITNNFLKITHCFLKYGEVGVFHKYEIVNDVAEYRHSTRDFTMSDVLNISWEVLEIDYFKNVSDE